MATISEVARLAQVSVSTVSYAISGSRPISEETRQRVFAAMEELGYRPHAIARGLASRRSRILALLFPFSERGLGITELEFVTSAADAAMARGYHMVLWPAEMRSADDLRNLTQQSLVDGVVVMEVQQADLRVAALRELGTPFTLIGRCADNTGLDFVDVDFETTIHDAVAYVVRLGHTNIGYIAHSPAEFAAGYGPTVRSCAAFEQELGKLGLRGALRLCDSSPREGALALDLLYSDLPEMSALLIMNDRAIPGVQQALIDRSLQIPDDLSLVTIATSARVGEMVRPALTTFAPPSIELARLGVELLIDKLENDHHRSRQTLISCRLLERGSTAPLRTQPLPA